MWGKYQPNRWSVWKWLVAILVPAGSWGLGISDGPNQLMRNTLLVLSGYNDAAVKDNCPFKFKVQRRNFKNFQNENATVCVRPYTDKLDFLRFGFSAAVVNGAKALISDHPLEEQLEKSFFATYGVPLVKKRERLANLDEYWIFFNPKALKVLFKKSYLKPNNNFDGYSLQALYDYMLRDFVRKQARLFAEILGQKALFEKLAEDYYTKAKADKKFNGRDFCIEAAKRMGGDAQTVGTLLRRQVDGTLPVIVNLLKKIIEDYDKELFLELKDKF
jgi:hypothetical protein